jgi:hypothetical protein
MHQLGDIVTKIIKQMATGKGGDIHRARVALTGVRAKIAEYAQDMEQHRRGENIPERVKEAYRPGYKKNNRRK